MTENTYRILIAEDVPTDVFLAEREIKRVFPKYELKVVETSQDFINALNDFKPDIILSDYSMPVFDGLTALKLAQSHAPLTPFILVTGSVNEETAVECMKAGADDYLIKEHIKRLGPAMVNAIQQKNINRDKINAEKRLEENEKMYRLMFEGNPQPMFIYDCETLEILEVNQSAIDHYGYSKAEFLALTIKDIRPKEDIELLLNYIDTRDGDLSRSSVWRHKKKNNEIIFVENISHNIYYNKRPARHVMVTDITERKKMQEALLVSEEKYRTFFENVQDVFFIIGLDGVVIDISPSVTYFSEYDPKELIGKSIYDLYCDISEREQILHLLTQMDEVRDFEMRFLTKSGNMKFCTLNTRLVKSLTGEPTHYEGALKDITERKKAEKFLAESEKRFRNLFENNLSVMLLIDPEEYKIIDANHAAVNFYGWTRLQLTNMYVNEINTLGEQTKYELEKALSQKQMHFEFKHKKADGSVADVEVFTSKLEIKGKTYLHSIVHDITTRKEAEKLVKLLSRAIEQSPVSLMITDREGNLVYVNPKFTEITGYEYNEVIGKNPRFLNSGHHSERFYSVLWDTILAGDVWHGEFKNKRKNGEMFWDRSVISSITNESGEIEYFIAVQENITELKKLTSELVKAKEKAEESDKLKTAFLHTISHEIRTPINAIVGFSEFVGNQSLSQEKRVQFVDIIIKSSNQLLSIFTDMVNMATIEAGQEKINEKNTDINSMGWLIHEQFLPIANEKTLELTFVPGISEDTCIISIDETKLIQVLTNLVSNAVKFTISGSVSYGYEIKDTWIQFYVKDTGIGIPQELHEEIFKRFRQADYSHTRKFGGSGLGLAISKAYIEMLGGKIWFNSVPDKGSEFYFSVPFKQPVIEPNESPNQTDELRYTGPQKNILVVEDEENNYLLVEEILKNSNYTVIYAENGAKAVEICKQRNDIDLILMDIKMPVMGGYEATKKIREFYKNVPIIAQTAFIQDYDREHAAQCGIDDYICKPFKVPLLLEVVKNYIIKTSSIV